MFLVDLGENVDTAANGWVTCQLEQVSVFSEIGSRMLKEY